MDKRGFPTTRDRIEYIVIGGGENIQRPTRKTPFWPVRPVADPAMTGVPAQNVAKPDRPRPVQAPDDPSLAA